MMSGGGLMEFAMLNDLLPHLRHQGPLAHGGSLSPGPEADSQFFFFFKRAELV